MTTRGAVSIHRAALSAFALVGVVACSRPQDVSDSASVASAPPETASASASASVAVPALPRVKRDGEAEVAAIAPFDPALIPAEVQRRLDAALTVCGGPRRGYSFDVDLDAPPPVDRYSLCKPATHAKLLAAFAVLEAKNPQPLPPRSNGIGASSMAKPPTRWEDAVSAFRLALALDAGTTVGKDAGDSAQDAFASAKRRGRGVTGLASSMSPADKVLESQIRAALPRFAFCYAAGMVNNPNLQGEVVVEASLEADGWLEHVKAFGSLPDAAAVACVARSAEALVLGAALKPPAPIRFTLEMRPDQASLDRESARRRAGLPP